MMNAAQIQDCFISFVSINIGLGIFGLVGVKDFIHKLGYLIALYFLRFHALSGKFATMLFPHLRFDGLFTEREASVRNEAVRFGRSED